MAWETSMDARSVFQMAHAKARATNPPGHWKAFVLELARGSVLRCKVCGELRDKRQPAAEQPAPKTAATQAANRGT